LGLRGTKQQNGDYYIMRSFLAIYYSGDQIEKNEMDGTCSTYGGEERCIQGSGGETVGKETTVETQV
jgi:hypothetical protein